MASGVGGRGEGAGLRLSVAGARISVVGGAQPVHARHEVVHIGGAAQAGCDALVVDRHDARELLHVAVGEPQRTTRLFEDDVEGQLLGAQWGDEVHDHLSVALEALVADRPRHGIVRRANDDPEGVLRVAHRAEGDRRDVLPLTDLGARGDAVGTQRYQVVRHGQCHRARRRRRVLAAGHLGVVARRNAAGDDGEEHDEPSGEHGHEGLRCRGVEWSLQTLQGNIFRIKSQ